MASSYLVVEIVDANVPSSSNATSVMTYYVELRFNGQIAKTETKENPVWNREIRFHMGEQQDEDDAGLNLEAAVYSIDEMSSSESVLGEAVVVVDNKYFDSHPSEARQLLVDLMKSCSRDDVPELSRAFPNGKLTLKVSQCAADEKLLFEIKADDCARQTEDVVDNLFKFLFRYPSMDHSNGDEDTIAMDDTSTSSRALKCDEDISPTTLGPSFERGKVVEWTSAMGSTRGSSSNEKNSSASIRALTSKEVDFVHGKVVKRMKFLFVVVVKARGLPDVDAAGLLDPFVEVKFGTHIKESTKCLKRDANPEWNKTFAFSFQDLPTTGVQVVVKDKDLLRDDFVGKLRFYKNDIQDRQEDGAPEPTWHPLLDERGKATLGKASLLLAIWIGSQADEAYGHAWESPYGPKVYENPRLWCLRVNVVELFQGVVACDEEDEAEDEAAHGARARSLKDKLFCKVCLGEQKRTTRPAAKKTQSASSGSYRWREDDFVFIAASPLFESNLQVSVVAASSFGGQDQEEVIVGQTTIQLAQDKLAQEWFDLKNPHPHPHPHLDQQGNGGNLCYMRIRLRILLDGRYHIACHYPQGEGYMMDDMRPAERQLWGPPVGRLHLGILSASLPQATDGDTVRDDGRSSAQRKLYCVAKYGDKWVRTRTIMESSDPVFNEQYTWDVYDIATVLTVGVFEHCTVRAHHRIGKVRITLSTLQTDRVYAHAYSLLTLSLSGAKITGELNLALKITLPSTTNMLRMYARPSLPKMNYVQPLKEDTNNGKLWSHAAKIMELRLERLEPPLRKEVVAYMCNVESFNNNSFSLRRSKANFFRVMAVLSPVITSLRWFEADVLSWWNFLSTLLIHAILLLALWFHGLILTVVLVCLAFMGVWNYFIKFRPQNPTYLDLRLSCVDTVHPDELDEEFDTINNPCLSNNKVVRMRYNRLRSVAGRIQTVVGDVATQFERIQSLLSWRDSMATAIFMVFLLIAAAVAFLVPYKLILAVAGFYIMRPPWLRTKTPSIFMNFFMRLPSREDMLLM